MAMTILSVMYVAMYVATVTIYLLPIMNKYTNCY